MQTKAEEISGIGSTEKIELSDCPFCGAKAKFYNEPCGFLYAGCTSCGCRTPSAQKKKTTVKIWNKRMQGINPDKNDKVNHNTFADAIDAFEAELTAFWNDPDVNEAARQCFQIKKENNR